MEKLLFSIFPVLKRVSLLNQAGIKHSNVDGLQGKIKQRAIKNLPLALNLLLYFIVCLGYLLNKGKLIDQRHRYRMFYPFYVHTNPARDFTILEKLNIKVEDTQIVSCSLYGNKDIYLSGCLRNAQHFQKVFPGWKMRVYCHNEVRAEVIDQLVAQHCQVVIVGEDLTQDAKGNLSIQGMFWRFLPLGEALTFVVLDVDDQWHQENHAIAQHWLETAKTPFFRKILPNPLPWPKNHITGKNWGAKNAPIPDIQERILRYKHRRRFGDDELFLRKVVFPEAVQQGLASYLYQESSGIWSLCPNRRSYRQEVGNNQEYVF